MLQLCKRNYSLIEIMYFNIDMVGDTEFIQIKSRCTISGYLESMIMENKRNLVADHYRNKISACI